MIADFTVENFGPFRDPTTLSLRATSLADSEDNLIHTDTNVGDLLSCALIYGPNASGKTFVIRALHALVKMVEEAHPEGRDYVWYRPFKLDSECLSKPVSFRIRLVEEGILYDYALSYDRSSIVSESLHYYPNGRRATVFARDGKDFKGWKGRKLLDLLNGSTTYLHIASRYNDPVCSKVWSSLTGIRILQSQDLESLAYETFGYYQEHPEIKKDVLRILRMADLDITDFSGRASSVSTEPEDGPKGAAIDLIHTYMDGSVKGITASFDIDEEESTGTRYMFGMAGVLTRVLNGGDTILMDELCAHLHPILTRWFVSQFTSINNPNHAQLVAVTHDVGLMDTDMLLRRDQIFFTDKGKDGASELYSLADFNGVRKQDRIRNAYLLGRYQAVPEVVSRGVMDV